MREFNTYQIKKGRILNTKLFEAAILDYKRKHLKLHINCFDWIDQRSQLIKLLISRGQVKQIRTHSDLMAHDDYLKLILEHNVTVIFEHINKSGHASKLRMDIARAKYEAALNKKMNYIA